MLPADVPLLPVPQGNWGAEAHDTYRGLGLRPTLVEEPGAWQVKAKRFSLGKGGGGGANETETSGQSVRESKSRTRGAVGSRSWSRDCDITARLPPAARPEAPGSLLSRAKYSTRCAARRAY